MKPTSRLTTILWWGTYTILGVWVQKVVPGVDFFAPGIVLSMQEEGGFRTLWLTVAWVLLLEGMGNLPFGYGVAWYGLLVTFYIVGRWLFEARSILFMCLLGVGLGVLHPLLMYGLGSLGNLQVPLREAALEGTLQALTFPLIWLLAARLYPKGLRQDVRSL